MRNTHKLVLRYYTVGLVEKYYIFTQLKKFGTIKNKKENNQTKTLMKLQEKKEKSGEFLVTVLQDFDFKHPLNIRL